MWVLQRAALPVSTPLRTIENIDSYTTLSIVISIVPAIDNIDSAIDSSPPLVSTALYSL